MKFHNPLEEVLASPARWRVLRTLLSSPSERLTGREIARRANVSAMGAQRALATLENTGMVFGRPVGKSRAWEVQHKHFLVRRLMPLATVEADAVEELKRVLFKHLPMHKVERIYLFGSRARGDERTTSDIDVLVVTPRASDVGTVQEAGARAVNEALDTFANPLTVLAFGRHAFEKSGRALFTDVQTEGQLLYAR